MSEEGWREMKGEERQEEKMEEGRDIPERGNKATSLLTSALSY